MSKIREPLKIIAEIDSNGSHYLFKIADDMQKMPDFEGDSLDYLASSVLSSIVEYWCKADMDDLSYILGVCEAYTDLEIGLRTKRNIMELSRANLDTFPDFYNTKLTLIDLVHRLDRRSRHNYRFTEPEVSLSRNIFVIWMEFD